MAVTKVINVKVQDGDLNQLESELKQVDKSFDKVDKSAKKASKSVDDVAGNGGAIAILDSLTGGLATRLRDAYEASRLFNGSLKATRGALIATGIGAFAVVLGTIVAYWDDIVEFITQANAKLEEQRVRLEQNETILDGQLKLNKSQQELAKAQGKNVDELIKKEKQLNEQKLANLNAQIKILESQLKTEESKVKEVGLWEKIKISALQAAGLYDQAAQAIAESVVGDEEERKNLADRQKQILDLRAAAIQLEKDILLGNSSSSGSTSSSGRDDVGTVDAGLMTSEEDLEKAQKESKLFKDLFGVGSLDEMTKMAAAGLEVFQNSEELKTAITQNAEDKRLAAVERAAKKRIEIEEAVKNAKIGIAQNTLALVGQIAEEGSAVAKGIQVAQTIISTIQGVQNAYTTAQKSPITAFFPAYPIIQAGLAGAFGAVQVKKILSTDASGRTTPNLGTSVGGSRGAGGGSSAPSFNVVGQSGVNQLAQSLQQDQQPIQAYVVGSNVTTQQELDRNIVETATLD